MKKTIALFYKIATFYLPLFIATLFIVFPLYWTINLAFTKESEIVATPLQYFPGDWTFQNFVTAWIDVGIWQFFFNSLIIAVSTSILIIIFAILAAYGLSRFKFKGKKMFMFLLLSTQFFPGAVLVIPLFLLFQTFGLLNKLPGVILVYLAIQLPFNLILMKGFITNIPPELEEAAMVDGCSRLKAIFYVILPILLPGIVAVAAFSFIGAWNEFLFGMIFLNDPNLFTVPVGLSYMMGQYNVNYGSLAAGSIIALFPPIIVFSYIQKYLVKGLSSGAVKG